MSWELSEFGIHMEKNCLKNRKIQFLKPQSTAAAVIRMYKRAIVTLIRATVALHLKCHRQCTSSKVQLSKSEEQVVQSHNGNLNFSLEHCLMSVSIYVIKTFLTLLLWPKTERSNVAKELKNSLMKIRITRQIGLRWG